MKRIQNLNKALFFNENYLNIDNKKYILLIIDEIKISIDTKIMKFYLAHIFNKVSIDIGIFEQESSQREI